jgi:hypothetical protein
MSGARISPEVSALLDRRRLLERKPAEGIAKRDTLSADGQGRLLKVKETDPLADYREAPAPRDGLAERLRRLANFYAGE